MHDIAAPALPSQQPTPLSVLIDGTRPPDPGRSAYRFFQTTSQLLEDETFPHEVTLRRPGSPQPRPETFDLVQTLGVETLPREESPLVSVFDVHELCSSRSEVAKARALRRACGVVCPTEAAKSQIQARFGLDSDQLHVVPPTPAAVFQPREPALCKALLPGLNVRRRFLLAVGGLHPRRSPRAIIHAAQTLNWLGIKTDVVFVGKEAPNFDLAAAAREHDRVGVGCVNLGFVGREVLGALYASAFAVVLPCSKETSCLPILEAFASDTPVVTNATPASLEIGGDAALYADPAAELWLGLASQLTQLAENPFLVSQQIQRGRAHLRARHQPDHCLSALARAYESAAGRLEL